MCQYMPKLRAEMITRQYINREVKRWNRLMGWLKEEVKDRYRNLTKKASQLYYGIATSH